MPVVHVISPVVETPDIGFTEEATAAQLAPFVDEPDVALRSVFLDHGPSSIEDAIDHALCLPDLLRKAIIAERAGSAAILIDCMMDPGLDALKAAVSIPVIGVGETAYRHAAGLGQRFSILGAVSGGEDIVRTQLFQAGILDRLASIRYSGVAVEDIDGHGGIIDALLSAALPAVEDDGAEALVFGCTGFIGLAAALEHALLAKGHHVAVVDPLPFGVSTLAGLAGSAERRLAPVRTQGKRIDGFGADDPLQQLYTDDPA